MAATSYLSALTAHPLLLAFSALVVIPFSIVVYDALQWMRMPPGPTPLPFVGNKFQIPKSQPWVQFQEWSKRYGPIFTLWNGRTPMLILSDPNIAVDLMEKRSQKFSSRPRMVMMGEVYNQNASILTQPYGKGWSIRRKLMHQALNPKSLRLYKPTQEAEAVRLCNALLQNPAGFEKEIERFTSSVVFCVAYGHRIDSLKAKVIRDRFTFMHFQALLIMPGRYLAETLPLLAKLPSWLAPWKAEAADYGRREGDYNVDLLDMVKSDIAQAQAAGKPDAVPESLSSLILEFREKEHVPLSERNFSYIPGSLFGAGSDTTASTLCSAMLALVTNTSVLQAAHAELDSVIGSDRTPSFADEERLPYLRALCKETLRWRPVAVLGGTPHASTEADEYNGYLVPKGTTVLGNSWAINLNEEYYPSPHTFDPVRFLSDAERAQMGIEKQPYLGSKVHPAKSGHSSFGWGRRICPGAGLAENSLFIALAKLLWAFDVLPLEGRTYDIFDYTNGINVRPKPFECVIRVRSGQHQRVLEGEIGGAMEWLERFTPFGEE